MPTLKTSADPAQCSFCGKTPHQVGNLIGGPGGVFICNECVRLCGDMLEEQAGTPESSGSGSQVRGRKPNGLLMYVDAVTVPVPDLASGLEFYCGVLGQELLWRNDALGQAGLGTPGSSTEVVLSTELRYEPDWKVASADEAAELFSAHGGNVVQGPIDIPIGRLVVVEDPFANRLVLLDSTKGQYQTDDLHNVIGVS
jgi:catechol 2,3-dioxygenase-like lactoylglutathione lyase family enzyme